MASKFVTVLQEIGKDFEKGLGIVQMYAPIAMPVIAATNPAAAVLFGVTLNTVSLVEQKFAAIGKQSGTGNQKAAEVLQAIEPYILQVFGTTDQSVAKMYVDAVVAGLNIPMPTPAPKQ